MEQSYYFTETFKALPSDISHCGPTDADIRYEYSDRLKRVLERSRDKNEF